MDTQLKNLFKSAMSYGAALGIISVIFSLLLYFLNVMPIGIVKPLLLSLVSIAIYFVGILYFSKMVRNELYSGEVNYSQALLIGVLIGFFTAIIASAYTYLQNVVIDPDYVSRYLDLQKEWMANYMYNKGVPDSQIESTIKAIEEAGKEPFTFVKYVKSVAFSTLGFGLLSLITAAIIKKKNTSPFEDAK
jgi:hypothetical protein